MNAFIFFIKKQSFGHNGSTESPFQQTANPDNYEVIDVANQQGDGEYNAKTMTGQTTRYFTNGEVDDDFWLKHLGEDYKNAIHMVVNNKNQYHRDHSPYNMTGSEAHIIQEDNYSSLKGNPVEYNDKLYSMKDQAADINSAGNSYVVENGSGTNATAEVKDTYSTTVSPTGLSSNETMQTLEQSNRMENVEKPYERDFAMPAENTNNKLVNKFYNPNSFYIRNNNEKHEKTSQNTDTRNTYTQQQTTDTHRHSQTDNTNTNQKEQKTTKEEKRSLKSGNMPVIVNLPVPEKNVYQLDGNDKPVVLQMPPVIYHSKPTYMQQHETNPQRHITQIQQTMTGQTPIQYHHHHTPHSPTYQTHYGPQQYSYQYQDYPYRQQVAAPLPYRKQTGVFNSFPSKQNANKPEVGPKLHYIISKGPTGKKKTGKQITKDDDVPCLTRVSRSNQELFEIGL